ncbi:MAG: 1-deoxy-D-xylulose-5-phosphate reductoisomerase [Candidatus Peregrinibacteria bacterium]
MKKSIILLGATGSIGTQTLEILEQFPEAFDLVGISGGKQWEKLLDISEKWNVPFVFCDQPGTKTIPKSLDKSHFFFGEEGLSQIAEKNADIYVNAISGIAGVKATEEIIKHHGTNLCLANKESLVMKGLAIMDTIKNNSIQLFPIDSEHSSMASLLEKVQKKRIKKIWLTASGGPFRDATQHPLSSFSSLTAKDALHHPTWTMGPKISVDSATLMNKAFELIEAVRLFDLPPDIFEVVVHPQSIVHSAIETEDGNILMEASSPNMKLPIARALFKARGEEVPEEFSISPFSPFGKSLTFEAVDEERFPSLQLAKKALASGERACEALLRKNDELVEQFLNGEIFFGDILKGLTDTNE